MPPSDAKPPKPRSDGPYVFVSYKHQDIARIAPVLALLEKSGERIWSDEGLTGGVEWDEELENRIANCRLLVAFLSQAAIESKYCRREVKFADAIDRPILGVMIEEVELAHGLRMLMQQYQMLDVRSGSFPARLDEALANANRR